MFITSKLQDLIIVQLNKTVWKEWELTAFSELRFFVSDNYESIKTDIK